MNFQGHMKVVPDVAHWGTDDPLAQLRDPTKRPPVQLKSFSDVTTNYQPDASVRLDKIKLPRNFRSARKGSAPGPNGLRTTYLKPVLEYEQATTNLVEVATRLANADVPNEATRALKLCFLTALRKGGPGVTDARGPSSRVRGLAVGDCLRRLVSKTRAQQYASSLRREIRTWRSSRQHMARRLEPSSRLPEMSWMHEARDRSQKDIA